MAAFPYTSYACFPLSVLFHGTRIRFGKLHPKHIHKAVEGEGINNYNGRSILNIDFFASELANTTHHTDERNENDARKTKGTMKMKLSSQKHKKK